MKHDEVTYLAIIVLLIVFAIIVGIVGTADGERQGHDYVANEWCMSEGHDMGSYDEDIDQVVCGNALEYINE